MSALNGKVMNMMGLHRKQGKRVGYVGSDALDIKYAQFILTEHGHFASNQQLHNLCQQLLKSAFKSWVTQSTSLDDAIAIVVDWAQDVAIFPKVKEREILMVLNDGERVLVEKILSDVRTNRICLFENRDMKNVWVIVNETSADLEFEYSKYYTDALIQYEELYCDFMVYSEEEFRSLQLPEKVQFLKRG